MYGYYKGDGNVGFDDESLAVVMEEMAAAEGSCEGIFVGEMREIVGSSLIDISDVEDAVRTSIELNISNIVTGILEDACSRMADTTLESDVELRLRGHLEKGLQDILEENMIVKIDPAATSAICDLVDGHIIPDPRYVCDGVDASVIYFKDGKWLVPEKDSHGSVAYEPEAKDWVATLADESVARFDSCEKAMAAVEEWAKWV